MGVVFVSAGHGGFEGSFRDPGVVVGNTTEATEMIAIRDLVVQELKARGVSVQAPVDNLSLAGTIDWINTRASRQDVAVEIHLNSSNNTALRGATAYYYAGNTVRQRQATMLINSLIRRLPQLPNLGAKPDSEALAQRAFCRDIVPPSIVLELGFLSNPQDRGLIQTRRRDYALGLADGLQSWLAEVSGGATPTPTPVPTPTPQPNTLQQVNVSVNAQVVVNGAIIFGDSAYVPTNILTRLTPIDTQPVNISCLTYKNVLYVQAAGLRNFGVTVGWDASTRTVLLSSGK